jgi:O-glycosyl hydrolase
LYYDQRAPASGTTEIFPTKRFFALGHFSRYVRPGALRHDVANAPRGVHAMAFSQGKEWTVVTWNERTSPARYALLLPHRGTAHAAVITNDANELQPAVLPAPTTTGAWLLELPARTIATYSFRAS